MQGFELLYQGPSDCKIKLNQRGYISISNLIGLYQKTSPDHSGGVLDKGLQNLNIGRDTNGD